MLSVSLSFSPSSEYSTADDDGRHSPSLSLSLLFLLSLSPTLEAPLMKKKKVAVLRITAAAQSGSPSLPFFLLRLMPSGVKNSLLLLPFSA